MHDMTRLNGKTAVITGGATGIGLAAAKRFIEEGAFVFIFGRRQEALDAAVAELGPNARALKGSVSDEADLDRLYAAVKAERGTLDIVFANAGVGSQLKLGQITAEHIDETFDTNVKGTPACRTRGGRLMAFRRCAWRSICRRSNFIAAILSARSGRRLRSRGWRRNGWNSN
jgi:NAD(P)-dependent dehydrogenase (short-subunit alcohol dehydrogenase family)